MTNLLYELQLVDLLLLQGQELLHEGWDGQLASGGHPHLASWENWATATFVLWRFSMMTLLLITEKLPSIVRSPS